MRGLRLLGVIALAAIATGCKNQPAGPILVHGMNVNGYVFDYELNSPSSIQADSRDVHINTGNTQIEVIDGTLRVDGRSYGAVKPKDRISVDGSKVGVNGEQRTSTGK